MTIGNGSKKVNCIKRINMKKGLGHPAPKIILGFVALLVIAIAAMAYMYRFVEQIAAEEDINSVPRQKIYLVTNTQTLLYESETMGQLLEMEEEDYTHFNETLDKAHDNMEALRELVSDSLMLHRIDTIDILIERKRMNTDSLLRIWKEANRDLYAQNIKQALENKVETVDEKGVKERVETNKDTLIVQGKKRSFFQRLAEVFVPTAQDSSVLVRANEQVVKDTLVTKYDPNAAIGQTLRGIQSNVSVERRRLRELLVDRSSALRYDNSIITRRINQILRDMEEEELNASMERMQRRQNIMEKTSYLITCVAILALGVMIFFLILIGRDLFKSKYYRKQLEREKKYTEDLLQGREKLMLAISHDIRAPLSSVMGYIELLQRSHPNEQQHRYLKNMGASSNHILALVNDLLDFQRLDMGQMDIHPVSFKVSVLFQNIYDSFKPMAAQKGLALEMDLVDNAEKGYEGDVIRIRQLVGNLLSNAIKFTETGTVELTVRSLEADDENENPQTGLQITVRDTGIGIPLEEQEKIFAEFTRLPGAEKREGFGLGLSITHKLISLMGGEITLESTPGEGSSFTISLPLPFVADQTVLNEMHYEVETNVASFEGRSVSCLIIDDDLFQLVLMEEILKQNHIEVTSCINPNAVVELLKEKDFDIIISDIQMPGMDGYSLVQEIRASGVKNAETIPIVALSATVGADPVRYQEAGFTESLSKPFTVEQLISLLNKVLPIELNVKKTSGYSLFTKFAEGDKEASDAILRTFTEETTKNIQLLKNALEASDRKEVARIAHKLIPLFTMLNTKTLVQQLMILEREDVELSEAGWKHLLSDVISQASSIVHQTNEYLR